MAKGTAVAQPNKQRGGGPGRRTVVTGIVAFAVVVGVVLGRWFLRQWNTPPPYMDTCAGHWDECVASAKIFLDRDYAETKDLSKAFLTLLTAVFVGSITFSEKIVNLDRSSWTLKALMITCWCSLLLAIATCGAGLALMAAAAGFASYEPDFDYRQLEMSSLNLFIAAGLSFGAGLLALLCAGTSSLLSRSSTGD